VSGRPVRITRTEDVRRRLLADVLDGALAPGAKLPNEDQLAERFAVSRATVREAIRGLLETGYLRRRHGHGTFVSHAPVSRHALDATVSYTAMIREAGHEPGERVLRRDVREATEEEARRLELAPAAPVTVIERVRLADGRPVILSVDRIPHALLRGVGPEELDASLYVILERVGAPVRSATAQLRPVLATARAARLLGVPARSPLLHIDQVDFDAGGRPVMLSAEWHVADAFELLVNRRPALPPRAGVGPAGSAHPSPYGNLRDTARAVLARPDGKGRPAHGTTSARTAGAVLARQRRSRCPLTPAARAPAPP
jgi:GntR family transcriptional regulator